MTLALESFAAQLCLSDNATAEEIISYFLPIADQAVPTILQLHTIYRHYGEVLQHTTIQAAFAVEMTGKTVTFGTRTQAWDYWRANRAGLTRLTGKSL